jgi:putative methionine-R-sulfoxide reductase with GAF domain
LLPSAQDATINFSNTTIGPARNLKTRPNFEFARHRLTGAAIVEKRTINVGDVAADARYLTAFGSTRSEIIVPIFDEARQRVIGTIDVESELRDAFNFDIQALLERCADVISPLWHMRRPH